MSKVFLPNGMEAVEAEYKVQPIEEYNSNPFIQALPEMQNKEGIVRGLVLNQPFNIEERNLDASIRIHILQRIYKVFLPLPIHLEVWRTIDTLIRQGYVARNPYDKEYRRYLNEVGGNISKRAYEINARSSFTTTASCGLLAGFSGMGKTSCVNRVLSNFPQIICHNYYKGGHFNQLQLTWLRLEAPSSLKSLAIQFFVKTDELLGTNNFKRYMTKNLSTDALLSLMQVVCNNIGLGLIVLDEVQNLNRNSVAQIMGFLTGLINSCGVPILFVGTPASYDIFSNELRIARRVTGNSEIIWNSMDNDNQFKLLLKGIWRYQWTIKPIDLTDDMVNLFYYFTQGISDLVVKLFINTQKYAIESGSEKITEALVNKVAEEQFKFIKPMIEAIRSGNEYKINEYEDIRRIDANTALSSNEKTDKLSDEDYISDSIVKRINENKSKKIELDKDDLRSVIKKGYENCKSEYETLKEAGLIDDLAWLS
ncbi:cysteine protease domain, YopT-type [Clostridiales bacterium oral taxon 876 str. F0540]|nr:cysteine protease domain, YopT-type [Clostridiales bacterium oral taxon 876 str. F0540]